MRHSNTVAAFLWFLLWPAYVGAELGTTKLKAYTWFRYTMGKENGRLKESQFAVKRGYLRWEYTFSDGVKSRVTVDLFSSNKDPHGAGLKLKDAYVDLKYLIPNGKIKVGLQKTYFGLIYDWDYLPIEKSLEDKQKLVASGERDKRTSNDVPGLLGKRRPPRGR